MKTVQIGLALTGLLLSASVSAADVLFTGRAGAVVGMYKGETEISLVNRDTGDRFDAAAEGDNEPLFGVQLGVSGGAGDFFGDFGIELLNVKFEDSNNKRADILLTGGYFLNDQVSVFAGYRKGSQGEGFFDDDTIDESGFFLGAGLGGLTVGPARLNASLAYNLSEAKFGGEGESFDYPGFSLKVSGSLESMPAHQLQLRIQRFNGDESASSPGDLDEDGNLDDFNNDGNPDTYEVGFDLTETYLQLSYAYSFSL